MVNTRRNYVRGFIWEKKLFNENRYDAYYPKYHCPLLMNKELLPDGIVRWAVVLPTVPVLYPAAFIGMCPNSLTPSNIDDCLKNHLFEATNIGLRV